MNVCIQHLSLSTYQNTRLAEWSDVVNSMNVLVYCRKVAWGLQVHNNILHQAVVLINSMTVIKVVYAYTWTMHGMKFSTLDRDNDRQSGSCSVSNNKGGFWFNSCYSPTCRNPSFIMLAFFPTIMLSYECVPKVIQLSVTILVVASKGKAEGIYIQTKLKIENGFSRNILIYIGVMHNCEVHDMYINHC